MALSLAIGWNKDKSEMPAPSLSRQIPASGKGGDGGNLIITDNAQVDHAQSGKGGLGGLGGDGGAGGRVEVHGKAHVLDLKSGDGGDAGQIPSNSISPPKPDGASSAPAPGQGGKGVNGGGDGGSGAYLKAIIPVTPGSKLTIHVGEGGKQGMDGGDSYIIDPSVSTTPILLAGGGRTGRPPAVCPPTATFDANSLVVLNDCLKKIDGKPVEFYYMPNHDRDAESAVKSFFEQHGIAIADSRGKSIRSNMPFGVGMRCELIPPVVVIGPRPAPTHGPQGAFDIIPAP